MAGSRLNRLVGAVVAIAMVTTPSGPVWAAANWASPGPTRNAVPLIRRAVGASAQTLSVSSVAAPVTARHVAYEIFAR